MSNLTEMLGNFAYNVANNGFRGYPTDSSVSVSASGSSKTIILVIVIILIIIGGAIAIYFATQPKEILAAPPRTPGAPASNTPATPSTNTPASNTPASNTPASNTPGAPASNTPATPSTNTPAAPIECIGLGDWTGLSASAGNSISRTCPDNTKITAMCSAEGKWINVGECKETKLQMVNSCSSDINFGKCSSEISSKAAYVKVQDDGNLVVYDNTNNNKVLFETYTKGKGTGPYVLTVQPDGNLVLYDSAKTATWSSQTFGKGVGPYTAIIQDDKNFVLYDSNKLALWSSNNGINTTIKDANSTSASASFTAKESPIYRDEDANAKWGSGGKTAKLLAVKWCSDQGLYNTRSINDKGDFKFTATCSGDVPADWSKRYSDESAREINKDWNRNTAAEADCRTKGFDGINTDFVSEGKFFDYSIKCLGTPKIKTCRGQGEWENKTVSPGEKVSSKCPDGSMIYATCGTDGNFRDIPNCPIITSAPAKTCRGQGEWENKTVSPGEKVSRKCPDGSTIFATCGTNGDFTDVPNCPTPPRTILPIPQAPTPPPLDISSFKPQIHQKSGNCLDSNGKEVYIGSCNSGAFQKWNNTDNTIQHSSGKCLDSDGKTVYASDCNKTQFQSWTKEGNIYKHGQSGLCLDSDGNRLYLSACGATNEFQKWGNTASTVGSLIGNTQSIGASLNVGK